MAYCQKCGTELKEGARFCEKCGTSPSSASPVISARPVQEETPAVGVFTYFGLLLLFGIPFIGWICGLVFCFNRDNRNIRNFSRGWFLVFLLSVILLMLFYSSFIGFLFQILSAFA